MLKSKKVLLGISGSIAAYKAALLTRLLVKAGAEVKVIMTDSASAFITPLTLGTLSKNPVHTKFYNESDGTWTNHVELGLWADVMLIAPASANTLAKCANGVCDNLLIATYLSAKCPVVFAPAMDLDMYKHGSTVKSLGTLKSYGNHIIEAASGELASGLEGQGRLAEPEEIIASLKTVFAEDAVFKSKKILITAGPTQEPLDPVRYISNYSSGKMGYAIAEAFANAGAKVTLVSGPVSISAPYNVSVVKVQSAEQMFTAVQQEFSAADIIVYVAAVADYAPVEVADKKLKKKDEDMSIELKKTIDIAATLGSAKSSNQIAVGFALETDNALPNALSKLERKNLDMIVLNSLQDKGAGFRYDTNKITVVHRGGVEKRFELKSKDEVAMDILNEIKEIVKRKIE